MVNLNPHDIVFLDSQEFKGFKVEIESQYDFKIISTDLPKIISFTSKKLKLYTSKGSFFMKEKPKYCSDEMALKRSAHFQDYVSSQSEKVPKILLTKKYDFYITWNNRHYFLTDYKEGRHYNGSKKDLSEMVRALYLFQQHGFDYLNKYKGIRQDELVQFDSPYVASSIPDLKAMVETGSDKGVLSEILFLYENICSEYAKTSKDQYIMSHSDFIIFNLILGESGVMAINDFDNVKVLPRIHDMAEFLVSASLLNYLAPLTNLKFPVQTDPDLLRFNYIMNLYVSKFNLSDTEIDLLGSVAEVIWLWTLVLAVFKGDYSIPDLRPALHLLRSRKVRNLIQTFK